MSSQRSLGASQRLAFVVDADDGSSSLHACTARLLAHTHNQCVFDAVLNEACQAHHERYRASVKTLHYLTTVWLPLMQRLVEQGIPRHTVARDLQEAIHLCLNDLDHVTLNLNQQYEIQPLKSNHSKESPKTENNKAEDCELLAIEKATHEPTQEKHVDEFTGLEDTEMFTTIHLEKPIRVSNEGSRSSTLPSGDRGNQDDDDDISWYFDDNVVPEALEIDADTFATLALVAEAGLGFDSGLNDENSFCLSFLGHRQTRCCTRPTDKQCDSGSHSLSPSFKNLTTSNAESDLNSERRLPMGHNLTCEEKRSADYAHVSTREHNTHIYGKTIHKQNLQKEAKFQDGGLYASARCVSYNTEAAESDWYFDGGGHQAALSENWDKSNAVGTEQTLEQLKHGDKVAVASTECCLNNTQSKSDTCWELQEGASVIDPEKGKFARTEASLEMFSNKQNNYTSNIPEKEIVLGINEQRNTDDEFDSCFDFLDKITSVEKCEINPREASKSSGIKSSKPESDSPAKSATTDVHNHDLQEGGKLDFERKLAEIMAKKSQADPKLSVGKSRHFRTIQVAINELNLSENKTNVSNIVKSSGLSHTSEGVTQDNYGSMDKNSGPSVLTAVSEPKTSRRNLDINACENPELQSIPANPAPFPSQSLAAILNRKLAQRRKPVPASHVMQNSRHFKTIESTVAALCGDVEGKEHSELNCEIERKVERGFQHNVEQDLDVGMSSAIESTLCGHGETKSLLNEMPYVKSIRAHVSGVEHDVCDVTLRKHICASSETCTNMSASDQVYNGNFHKEHLPESTVNKENLNNTTSLAGPSVTDRMNLEENVKRLVHSLSHGCLETAPALCDVINTQRAARARRAGHFRMEPSLVATLCRRGPPSAHTVSGLLVQAPPSTLQQLATSSHRPRHCLFISGDVTPAFRHKGFKQLQQLKVTSRSPKVKENTWLDECWDVIVKLGVGALLSSGDCDRDLLTRCQSRDVLVLTHVTHTSLRALTEHAHCSTAVYLQLCTQVHVSTALHISAFTAEWADSRSVTARSVTPSPVYALISLPDTPLTTTVLSHPVLSMAEVREEQFWHTLYRFKHSVETGRVWLGGGATELQAATVLHKHADSLEKQGAGYTAEVYKMAARGLQQYACAVRLNNGHLLSSVFSEPPRTHPGNTSSDMHSNCNHPDACVFGTPCSYGTPCDVGTPCSYGTPRTHPGNTTSDEYNKRNHANVKLSCSFCVQESCTGRCDQCCKRKISKHLDKHVDCEVPCTFGMRNNVESPCKCGTSCDSKESCYNGAHNNCEASYNVRTPCNCGTPSDLRTPHDVGTPYDVGTPADCGTPCVVETPCAVGTLCAVGTPSDCGTPCVFETPCAVGTPCAGGTACACCAVWDDPVSKCEAWLTAALTVGQLLLTDMEVVTGQGASLHNVLANL